MTASSASDDVGVGPGRRRVLYVPVLFFAEPWNGIMEHLLALIEGLDRTRFEPILATRPDDGTQTTTLAERAGVPTADLGGSRAVISLRRILASVRPDLVHVHTPSTSGLAKLAVATRLARVPRLIVTLHQVAPEPLPLRSRAINRAGHLLVGPTIAVSADAADTQSRHAGLIRRRIEVIHNGVADAPTSVAPPLQRAAGTVWIGYFGRLATEKGVDLLIDALAEVRAGGLDIRALIAGDGYERSNLEELADRRGCGDATVFTGYRSDARQLMSEVDIVVHPPRFEGFGLVVAEAMAAARPVIATDVIGGIPDMVRDGHTGILVPFGDVPALAAAVRRLGGDADLRAAMGRAGRARYLEAFTLDRMIERTGARY